jgi:ParB family chromosome partitioning protein
MAIDKDNTKRTDDETDELPNPAGIAQFRGANIPRRRNVLGRGLASLMAPTAPVSISRPQQAWQDPDVTSDAATDQSRGENIQETISRSISTAKIGVETEFRTNELVYLPIESLKPSQYQPRKHFNVEELNELAISIKNSGLIQPLLARRSGNGCEIVAGERRWRAAQLAGLTEVPVIIRAVADHQALQLGLVENIQRSNLNPIEEAKALQRLIQEFGETQTSLGEILGKNRVSITNSLRLLKLPAPIQLLLEETKLTAGHARAILGLSTEAEQLTLAEKAVTENLSVREVEEIVADAAGGIEESDDDIEESVLTRSTRKKPKGAREALSKRELAFIEDKLRRAFGGRVHLNVGKGYKGYLKVQFANKEEMDRVVERVLKRGQ